MASERVNQRWPAGLKAAVERAASDRGLDATAFTVAAVRDALGEPLPESPAYTPPMPDPGRPPGTAVEGRADAHALPLDVRSPRALPNAIQLSTRTGLPKASCQRLLDRGAVRWIQLPESSETLLEIKVGAEWEPV